MNVRRFNALHPEALGEYEDEDVARLCDAVRREGCLHPWDGGFETFVGDEWYPAEDHILRKCVRTLSAFTAS